MEIHQIRPKHRPKKKKRVGRGGKRGTYSGRGIKGQKARAGAKLKPIIRELIKRYPKKRGYRFGATKPKPAVINVGVLDKKFKAGETVSPVLLIEKRIIRRRAGKIPQVKILAKGEIKKKIIVKDCLFSLKAKEKIEKAGGKIL